jgi:hypothetical protein
MWQILQCCLAAYAFIPVISINGYIGFFFLQFIRLWNVCFQRYCPARWIWLKFLSCLSDSCNPPPFLLLLSLEFGVPPFMSLSCLSLPFLLVIFKQGDFLGFFSMYCIQNCFICRPSDSTVSEDAALWKNLLDSEDVIVLFRIFGRNTPLIIPEYFIRYLCGVFSLVSIGNLFRINEWNYFRF